MMGFGSSSYGQGGYSTSSNLSPLAPPFTFGWSSSRPSLNIYAQPYGTPYTSSTVIWGQLQSPPPGPDYEPKPASETVSLNFPPKPASEVVSLNFPSSTIYQSFASADTPLDHVAFAPTSLADINSFNRYQSCSTNNDAGKGLYYAPSSTWYKSSSLLGTGIETAYDMTDVSKGIIATQDDYTQSLYSLQYPPTGRDHSWDGHSDLECGGMITLNDSLHLEVPNPASSAIYSNYRKEVSEIPKVLGKTTRDYFRTQSNKFVDRDYQVTSVCMDKVQETPLSQKNPEPNPLEPSTSAISGIFPTTYGVFSTTTSAGSVTDPWSCQKPPSYLNKQNSINIITSTQPCVTELTIRPPPAGTSSSLGPPPQETVNHGGSSISGNMDNFTYTVKNPWVHMKSKQGPEYKKFMDHYTGSSEPEKYECHNLCIPSKYGEPSSKSSVANGDFDFPCKERTELHCNMPNLEGFSLLTEQSDQYNPSEDSPCWKGAGSLFSPFQVSEAVPTEHHKKSLNFSHDFNHRDPQTLSCRCEDSTVVFAPEFHEKRAQFCLNGEADHIIPSSMSSIVINLNDELRGDLAFNADFDGMNKLNSGVGISFSNDSRKPREANAVEKNSVSDRKLETVNPIQLSLETMGSWCGKETASIACMLDKDVNLNDFTEESISYVPEDTANPVLSSPSSDEEICSKHTENNWKGYSPKVEFPALAKTILSLSDSLLLYYLKDEPSIRDEDCKIVEHVLSNLNACLKFAQQKAETKESLIHEQGQSNIASGLQLPQHLSPRGDRPQVTSMRSYGDKGQTTVSGSKNEEPQEPVLEADTMTKAIKKILEDNFHEDADMKPLARMYKSLWLEAEAALCSTNCKARFHRMKLEIEKCQNLEAKETSPLSKTFSTPEAIFQEASQASKMDHDIGVTERYNILKCRVDSSTVIPDESNSLKISSNQLKVDMTSPQVNDLMNSNTFAKGANPESQSKFCTTLSVPGKFCLTNSNNNSQTDEAEDPIMARLHVLKTRADYPTFMASEPQPLEITNIGFVGKRNYSLVFEDGHFDGRFAQAPEIETFKISASHTEDRAAATEYHPVTQSNWEMSGQSGEVAGLGVQFSGGWYESTSSDWEHVLKDEFSWNAGAIHP